MGIFQEALEEFNNNLSRCTTKICTTDWDLIIKGECLEGHQGALGYECAHGLAQMRPKSLCKNCDFQPFIYAKILISFILILAYIVFR